MVKIVIPKPNERISPILLSHERDTVRDMLKSLLKQAGYQRIVAVDNGRSAITRLRASGCQLLVTGTTLKDIDGWRLIRMVRSGRFCAAALPVIVVSDSSLLTIAKPVAEDHGATLISYEQIKNLPDIADAYIAGFSKIKPKVLIIEDDEKAAQLAKLALQNHYHVDISYDGDTGLEAWLTKRHDLVLLDVQLPSLSGTDVLKHIIAEVPLQPILVITAYPTRDRHRDLILAGAADFISKPFSLNELRRICEGILRQAEYLAQCSEMQQEIIARHAVGNRLWAAKHCIESGQIAMASYHINNALVVSRETGPTDDEWSQLVNEFEEM